MITDGIVYEYDVKEQVVSEIEQMAMARMDDCKCRGYRL